MTYDLHTLQNRFYLTGHAVASLHTATPLMRGVIREMKINPIDSLAFPDAGAHKRFAKLFQKEIPNDKTIICEKVRDGARRIITVIEGGKILTDRTVQHILIVDDMINSGGTLLECARKLKEIGGETLKISVFITHAIFNDNFFQSVQKGYFRIFETIYTTDSIPNQITNEVMPYGRRAGEKRTVIKIPREEKASFDRAEPPNPAPMSHFFNDNMIKIEVLPLAKQVISDL